MKGLELSISTCVFGELEPEDALKRLVDIGWRNFELDSEHLAMIDKRESPREDFSALRDLSEKLTASIPAIHYSPEVEPERTMQWAHILGVKWIVIHPIGADMTLDEQAAKQANLKMLQEWLGLAYKFKVGLAIENMHDMIPNVPGKRSFGATPSDLLWLVQHTDPSLVGICWDTCHAYVQGLNQYQAIKRLGRHLVHTHINDNISTVEEQHLIPFEGKVDWRGIIRALREIKYDGLFNIEDGFSIKNLPLTLKKIKLRYLLKLAELMIESL